MEFNLNAGPKISLNQNIWLVSFGDLLTLILCFFISVISLSPLNPERKQQIQDGTQIALNKEEIKAEIAKLRSISLDFYESDIAYQGMNLSDKALERLRKHVSSDSYSYQQVKVETCGGFYESDISGSWSKRVRFLENLQRQIIGVGLKAANTLYSPLTGKCSENVLARIVLDF